MRQRLYYLFYKEVSTRGRTDQFFKAYIGFCFLEYMNLGSMLGALNYILKYHIPKNGPLYGTIFIFGGVLLYNYFTLWVKKEDIVSNNENRPNRYGRLLIWSFITLSFSFFYVVLKYFVKYNPH